MRYCMINIKQRSLYNKLKNKVMINLQKQIDFLNKNINSQLPQEIILAFADSIADLKNGGLENSAIKKGASISPFNLLSTNQQYISSNILFQYYDQIILAFFRGNWCPYCSLELKALQDALIKIETKKVKLLAISPQRIEYSNAFANDNQITFDILYDQNNTLAKNLGIAFKLQDNIIPYYQKLNIDLETYNGNDSNILPIPAIFVISKKHEITYSFVDANYMNRVNIGELIQNL